MCSLMCQCPITAKPMWTSISEADLNYIKRTKVEGKGEFDDKGMRRMFFNTTTAENRI